MISHDSAWFLLFVPALLSYIAILTQSSNSHRVDGSIPEDIKSPSGRILIPKGTKIEVLASGFEWSEGPAWIDDPGGGNGFLVFSDTIANRVWRYDQGNGIFTVGKSLYIDRSGCSVDQGWCERVFEPGSNGIARLPWSVAAVDLVLCQHGERAISLLFQNGTQRFIATHYQGKRLNSPNDLVWSKEGDLYFTDPPYGLYDKTTRSELLSQEIGHYGIYMIHSKDVEAAIRTGIPTDNLILLDKSLTRPNGIALSPDERTLYVSNSDSANPVWIAFDRDRSGGLVQNRRIFANALDFKEDGEEYSGDSFPDGFKVSNDGIIVSSGPMGVYLILPHGKLLAKIKIPRKVSNVAFGRDGFMYVTAQDVVLRIQTALTDKSDS